MNTLELFSGTKSFSKNRNFNNISVDIDRKSNPDICQDIMTFDYKQYEPGYFDIIWASPPCTEYSTCLTTRPRNLEFADSIVIRTLEIIDYLKPRLWFIENPFTGYLKSRSFMHGLNMIVVDYCKYGFNYRKRTAIWTNSKYNSRPLCKQNCNSCINGKHIGHFGTAGASCNIHQKHSIPQELLDDLIKN